MYQDFDPFPPENRDPWPWRAGVAVAIVLLLLDELTGLELGLVTVAIVSVVTGFVVANIRNSRKRNDD